MRINNLFFLQDLYTDHLATIEGIHFTHREIDIMACLLHVRGTSKISSLLVVSSHTVVTHVRNIMSKLECSSREEIIDFIEKSHKSSLFKKYYAGFVVASAFAKSLEKISQLKEKKDPFYLIVCEHNQNDKRNIFQQLENHLKKAGFQGEILYQSSIHKIKSMQESDKIIVLFSNKESLRELPQEFSAFDTLMLNDSISYYFSFFEILKKHFPSLNLDSIVSTFKESYSSMEESMKAPSFHVEVSTSELEKQKFSGESLWDKSLRQTFVQIETLFRKKTWYYVSVFLLLGVCGAGFWVQRPQQAQTHENTPIRSDLVLPTESILLNRPEFMNQLKDKFDGKGEIRTVALVGMGGVGKTTLARQYARTQKIPLIWQIKAETQESLKSSFERLAYALAQTENDKKIFKSIQDIKDYKERDEKIIHFVKERIKIHPHWLLIFDNVEKFTDIQPYFPYDPNIWGSGQIILTTRDINIQNNKHITHVIQMGELTPNQKLDLFSNIMTNGGQLPFTLVQKEGAKTFLSQIPPFPLDVAIAAYYLKSTNISYDQYLEHLEEGKRSFESIQENVLKESGDYAKTRYHIISLSLKQLMDTHKDFGELLLFISLLDSHHIPRDLLDTYKDNAIVDDFIYNLKKYYLITHENSPSSSLGQTLSIHRSTQGIGLAYLTKVLDLKQNHKLLQTISNSLENYMMDAIDTEDSARMKLLVSHCEWFLKHDHLLEYQSKEAIGGELGGIYFSLNNYPKAQQILEGNLKGELQNHTAQMAHTLVYLALVHRVLANYEKAKNLLEESLQIYKHHDPENHTRIAQLIAYLGGVEGELGNYEKSRDLLEQSLAMFQQHDQTAPLRVAWILTSLGNVYRELSEYNKAKESLEQSLLIYKKEYPENHVRTAWALALLGNVYRSLGQYDKSRDLLEQSLQIYKKNYPENNDSIAWVSTHLGNTYKELGNYEKAKDFLEKSHFIYKNYFNENHIANAWVLIHLGNTYSALSHEEKAREALEKGHHIYKTYNLGTAWSAAHLGNFYREQNQPEKAKNLLEQSLASYQRHHYEKDIRRALVLRYLGYVYRNLGDYKKARNFLEQSQNIYEKVYGQNHNETARVLQGLSKAYLLEGNLKEAERFLQHALVNFQQSKHSDIYIVYEDLAEVEFKKAEDAKHQGNTKQAQTYKTQAIRYLKQALETVKAHFPKDSPHIQRVQSKM